MPELTMFSLPRKDFLRMRLGSFEWFETTKTVREIYTILPPLDFSRPKKFSG